MPNPNNIEKAKKGLLIAGAAMLAEGVAFTVWGPRYLDFMERQGMMDLTKRLVRKLNIRSNTAFVAIGLTEVVWGLALLRRAQA